MHYIYPEKYQEAFLKISEKATSKGLKINNEKTQLISISSGFYDTKAIIKDAGNNSIESNEELKMLGFSFSTKPMVQLQLDSLTRKAKKNPLITLQKGWNRTGKT